MEFSFENSPHDAAKRTSEQSAVREVSVTSAQVIFLNFGFHPPPVFLFSLKVLSYCICPSDLFRCGPIWRGALRFFRCNSNTHDEGKAGGKNGSHKKKKKMKENGQKSRPLWWNMGTLESDSLRGHSIKGLKQSNQHTFFFFNSRTKPNNK